VVALLLGFQLTEISVLRANDGGNSCMFTRSKQEPLSLDHGLPESRRLNILVQVRESIEKGTWAGGATIRWRGGGKDGVVDKWRCVERR